MCCSSACAQRAEQPQLKTASTHPIQYYLSLPEGWTTGRKWPVVVVIESADREFLDAAAAFAKARQHQPFIVVTPLVVTNGGAGYRNVPTYHYSDAVWGQIQKSGDFRFDMEGITAIMRSVATIVLFARASSFVDGYCEVTWTPALSIPVFTCAES